MEENHGAGAEVQMLRAQYAKGAEELYKALGEFVCHYANIETLCHSLFDRASNLESEVARTVAGGMRFSDLVTILSKIIAVNDLPIEKKQDFRACIHFQDITALRHRLIHRVCCNPYAVDASLRRRVPSGLRRLEVASLPPLALQACEGVQSIRPPRSGLTQAPNLHDEFSIQFATTFFSWQRVEWELFFTFEMLVWARERPVNSALWSSVLNLNSRLAMIDACADVTLKNNPLRAEWKRLGDRTRDCARFRNHLAHLMPLAGPFDGAGNTEVRLVTSVWDESERKTVTYGVKDLLAIRASFDDLSIALSDFGEKLAKVVLPQGTTPRGAPRIPWQPKSAASLAPDR